MEKIIKWVQSLPKAGQILFIAGLVVVLGLILFYFGFGMQVSSNAAAPAERRSVITDFPDGNEETENKSKFQELEESLRRGHGSANDYWDSLGQDGEAKQGGLMGSAEPKESADAELDPTVYSSLEIYNIRKGFKTKAEVDAEHEELRRIKAEQEQARQREQELYDKMMDAGTPKKQADEDSVYLARLEKAYQLASKYQQPRQEEPSGEQPQGEPEPRTIDLQARSAIPSSTLSGDGIISSLEGDALVGGTNEYNGEVVTVPAKATFLKTETLVSGQRVIMRLMQDLRLSDGTLIPANTHISGTCSVGSRLKIAVKTVNFDGKIYYTDLDIYDNDGIEGIYCPSVADSRKNKSAKRIAREAGRTASDIASALVSGGSTYTSQLTRSSLNEIVQSIDENGNASVRVSAGYEFYMFENVKDR